ncbi:MAG TPA: DUF1330 domain-containing protein [Burkholderiaceae bacterium]|jgi:uncharacterized protein (DUF1330 family)|nr:DUF1330 domain-containing protein [Burkholderiaceae bacterium]
MAKGYWIARVDVADAQAYQKYVAANGPALAAFGARFLARGGRYECVQGAARSRNVVIEFPSYQAALDCWHSPQYQEVLSLRLPPVAQADVVVVEGFDGAQPG